MTRPEIATRPARPEDVPALVALINAIIAAGGTTAHQMPFDAAGFTAHYLPGAEAVATFVALDASGRPAGFQSLARHPALPEGWVTIGTFTRRDDPLPGAGRALFAATRDWAARNGLAAIDATIRADNTGGLAFYAAMGFQDDRVTPAVPLADGTPVDRISKVYRL